MAGSQVTHDTGRGAEVSHRWTPELWASWKPFGVAEQRPNNFFEVFRAVGENRDALPYAWRILRDGVCDGCALGTTGMQDWTLDGVHLCNVRLRLLRLNTMGPLDDTLLGDVPRLSEMDGRDLRDLGRLARPMIRERGDTGFRPLSWDDALDLVAERVRGTSPQRTAWYMTSRGIPNETYYMVQKAVRAMGSANVDNAARVCHSPSTAGLKTTIGAGATTCSYRDWIGTDLLVFIGSNPANNQPVTTKYMHYARKAGTRIAAVNTTVEPGMSRYWIPSIPESALFGTKLVEDNDWYLVNVGGDLAFLTGVLKHIVEHDWLDHAFVQEHTTGFGGLREYLESLGWAELERAAGTSRGRMLDLARQIGEAKRAVFVWSMGITQHAFGVDGVRAIVNLALTGGFVGREGCGLMPIRGHSGVQGGAEMGAYSTVLPGGIPVNPENAAQFAEHYGFDVPDHPGLIAPEMIDAAHEDALDVLWSIGGNFVQVLPDPDYVTEAMERIPLRVHQDIVLSSQMFIEPRETVLLLPAMTRYEIPGGVTQTSTERRIAFSPEIPGPRIPEARWEGEVLLDLARRVVPDRADRLHFEDSTAVREEIAAVVPFYAGIERLHSAGDSVQYGGDHLCAGWQFDTPDGKASFTAIEIPDTAPPEGRFRVATRRGKQFNSMVQEAVDPLNGTVREAVLMCAEDAQRLGLSDGDPVRLHNERGEMAGRVRLARLRPGNLEVHWPEGNVLIDPACRAEGAGVPDYNAVVELERVASEGR